ncbi:MAG: type II toxin-antitoxin system RelE/ParE family toxin [Nanoarchaeota archaeon]|nr:type II toxin-antitoxin system RelE/ParE family toxin [Nanoarchaeota archaeon]
MLWSVVRTDEFSLAFKKYSRDKAFVDALDKKIQKLKEDPLSIGGFLSGDLHGFKATRIIRKFRLIFRIDEEEKKVYLLAIDHRKFGYKRF